MISEQFFTGKKILDIIFFKLLNNIDLDFLVCLEMYQTCFSKMEFFVVISKTVNYAGWFYNVIER